MYLDVQISTKCFKIEPEALKFSTDVITFSNNIHQLNTNLSMNSLSIMPKMTFYDWSFSIILVVYAILYIKAIVVVVCLSVCPGNAWKILPVITSPNVTDSREKRNQGQSDFLRSFPRCN
jgi:hypothetical protein